MNINDNPKVLKIRRTMYIDGLALIISFAWNLLKSFMYLTMGHMESTFGEMIPYLGTEMGTFIVVVFTVIVLIAFVIELVAKVYVGTQAIKVGQNRKHGKLLIPAMVIAIQVSVDSAYSEVVQFMNTGATLNTLAGAAMDLIIVFIEVELLVDYIRLKVYEKREA